MPFINHSDFVVFNCRTDTTQLLRPKRLPLGSVDSEDGGAYADDEIHSLLPGTRAASNDDLSQVGFNDFDSFFFLFLFIESNEMYETI